MNKIAVKNKIMNIEAEISLLKKAVTSKPDFDIDEANWNKTKSVVKKTRAKIYKKAYG